MKIFSTSSSLTPFSIQLIPIWGVGAFPEWDSLGTFNLLVLVEDTFGVRFSPEDMAEIKTLADIRRRLRELGVTA